MTFKDNGKMAQAKMRPNAYKIWTTLCLLLFSVPTARASQVCLVSDPDNEMVAFAVGDIEKSLLSKGHTVLNAPSLKQMPASADSSIVLSIVNAAG